MGKTSFLHSGCNPREPSKPLCCARERQVVEKDGVGHAAREARGKARDLVVQIGLPGEATPASEFHNERVLNSIEFKGHGTRSSKGVGTNPFQVVALHPEVGPEGSSFEDGGYLVRGDMRVGSKETQNCIRISRVGMAHSIETTAESFYRAYGTARDAVMVDGAAALPVLLIVKRERGCGSGQDFGIGCGMWNAS